MEVDVSKTERDVLADLNPDEMLLLKRVLELERARLHVQSDLTDDIVNVVKEIMP